jgi:hypothetical protein
MTTLLPRDASDVTPVTDDQAIREALADLTDEQPPIPPDRFAAVQQRAIRHRRRQLTVVIASALAVTGLVAGLVRLPAIVNTGPLARPSWALQWPDLRNGGVPQSVLDDAVAGWVFSTGYENGSPYNWSAAAVTHLVKLFQPVWYVGQTIDHGQEIAVIFEWDASTIPWGFD